MRVPWAVPVAALAVLALSAGCSSAPGEAAPDGGDAGLPDGGDAAGGDGGAAVPCLGTYSGAVTGTFECAVSATSDFDAGRSVFSMAATARTGDASALSLPYVVLSGTLDAGTYGFGSAEIVQATSEVVAGDPGAASVSHYRMRYGLQSSPDLGDAGVTFSAVAPGAAEGDYDVHGSLGATLDLDPAPDGGAPPTVSLQATF